jgi:hypothetical protein
MVLTELWQSRQQRNLLATPSPASVKIPAYEVISIWPATDRSQMIVVDEAHMPRANQYLG